jgi:hypothetical protein
MESAKRMRLGEIKVREPEQPTRQKFIFFWLGNDWQYRKLMCHPGSA